MTFTKQASGPHRDLYLPFITVVTKFPVISSACDYSEQNMALTGRAMGRWIADIQHDHGIVTAGFVIQFSTV